MYYLVSINSKLTKLFLAPEMLWYKILFETCWLEHGKLYHQIPQRPSMEPALILVAGHELVFLWNLSAFHSCPFVETVTFQLYRHVSASLTHDEFPSSPDHLSHPLTAQHRALTRDRYPACLQWRNTMISPTAAFILTGLKPAGYLNLAQWAAH